MGKHSRQRAEQFAIRRWLQLGAASAGVSAALLGGSLLAEHTMGVASADGADGSSAAASAGDGGGPAETAGSRGPKASAARDKPAEADGTDDDARDAATRDDEPDTDAADSDADEASEPDTGDTGDADDAVSKAAEDDSDAVIEKTAATRPSRQERVSQAINDMTAEALEWIDNRPVSDARKERLEEAWAATRRTLFNQAPTVNPVQVTGVMDGPITGTIGAEDPDGDRIVYRVVKKPTTGTVTLNRDGSYSYTPGEGFNGVDVFVVRARDLGLHVNLLDWFRPPATRAESVINHRAITYDFTWVGDEWTADRKAAFQRAADYIGGFFVVRTPIVLSYELNAINDPDYLVNADTLAAFTEPPGFLQTSIQHEVITGVDVENGALQAFLNWNFAWKWATGDVVADDELDFQNTARHELLHSFGIYSLTGSDLGLWSVYDSFLTTADGTSLFGPDGKLRPDAEDYLNGLNGGAYFGGPHAIAAYGKPIPLSHQGSPSHLDRFVFSGDDYKLMNDKSPGTGWHNVRFISPIEYAMLQDLGFTMRPEPIS